MLLISACAFAGGLLGVLLGRTWRPFWDWLDLGLNYGLPFAFGGLIVGSLVFGIGLEARKILRRRAANDDQLGQSDQSTNGL